jgi:hypothetical protein
MDNTNFNSFFIVLCTLLSDGCSTLAFLHSRFSVEAVSQAVLFSQALGHNTIKSNKTSAVKYIASYYYYYYVHYYYYYVSVVCIYITLS